MTNKVPCYAVLVGATLIPNAGGLVASIFAEESIKTWYESLKKPDWRPPNWVFAPAWTTIYCSIGYASYLVYMDGGGFTGINYQIAYRFFFFIKTFFR